MLTKSHLLISDTDRNDNDSGNREATFAIDATSATASEIASEIESIKLEVDTCLSLNSQTKTETIDRDTLIHPICPLAVDKTDITDAFN